MKTSALKFRNFVAPAIGFLLLASSHSAQAWTTAMPTSIPWDYDMRSDGAVRTGTYTGNTSAQAGPKIDMPGRLYVPPAYTPSGSFALVIFFHGSGEGYTYDVAGGGNATNLDNQVKVGHADKLIQTAINRGFFLYEPQFCRFTYNGATLTNTAYSWSSDQIRDAVTMAKKAMKDYPGIDPRQVYVTGLSAGGAATRYCLSNFGDVFAAGIPLSSDAANGESDFYAEMAVKPQWIYHGRLDTSISPSASRFYVNGMRAAAGATNVGPWPICTPSTNPFYNSGAPYYTGTTTFLSSISVPNFSATPAIRYTEYSDGTHGASTWTTAYNETFMWDWILSQRLTPGLPAALPIGKTLLFDFGSNCVLGGAPYKDGTVPGVGYWNATVGGEEATRGPNMTGANNREIFPYAITYDKMRTSVSMELAGIFGSGHTLGVATGAPYANTKLNDDGWLTVVNATATTNTGILRFKGLTPNAPYEVKIWAAHENDDGGRGRRTRYEINGATQDLEVYSATNSYPYATFASVTADASGKLDVNVYPAPPSAGGTSRYGVINTLELKALNGDATPPAVAISSPTVASTYSTSSAMTTLAGTASDNIGVTSVTWSNDRGGSGTAAGTASWSVSSIALQTGVNVVTITATDAAGNASTDILTVTYNRAPVAVNDAGTLDEGTSTDVDVLTNDSDPDAWPQALSLVSAGTPSHGTASILSGMLHYVPIAGYYGPDSVSYVVTDGLAQTTGIVNFAVTDKSVAHDLTGAGLTGASIGVGAGQSSRVLSGGTDWEVNGSGSGIAGTADSFGFEGADLGGDFQIIVKVSSLMSGGTTPRAGIMLRESNNPDARMAYISTTTGTNYKYGSRTTVGGTSTESTPPRAYAYPDAWMMLQRDGDNVRLYVSSDDVTYTQVGTVTLTALAGTVKAGVFSSSGSVGVGARAVMSGYEQSILPILDQDFSFSSLYTDYFNASGPSADQVNDISSESGGGTWSINGGKLQLARVGQSGTLNGAGFSRWTSLAGPPTVLYLTFDFGVSNFNSTQNDSMTMDFGNMTAFSDYNNGIASSNLFASLRVDGSGSNTFKFEISGTASTALSANGTMYAVSMFLNKSGSSKNYRAPDGTTQTLNTNAVSLWVGTTPLLQNIAAPNGASSALTDFRNRFSFADSAVWMFDNITISKSLPQ